MGFLVVVLVVVAVLITGAAVEHVAAVLGVSWVTVVAVMWLIGLATNTSIRR